MNHHDLSQQVGYEKRLAAIKIQLHSQLPSDVRRGIDQARKLLQEKPLNYEIYPLLLEVATETPAQREEIRNLLQTMAQKGLKYADDALKNLDAITNPVQSNPDSKNNYPEEINTENEQSLIDDADDAYYAAEFDKAISLYRRVLQNEPNNKRAQLQLEKTELNRIAQQPNRKLPREAMQYYRRARSYIAARDIGSAIGMLNAAIEEAQANEMKFQEAEELLGSQQNLQVAYEYQEQAIKLIQEEKWEEALERYDRILKLDPEDETSRTMRDKLKKLLETEALLVTLADSLDDETNRKEKLDNIVSSIKAGEGIIKLTSTHRFQTIRARYGLYRAESDLHKWGAFTVLAPQSRLIAIQRASKKILSSKDSALGYIDEQLRRFKPFRIAFFASFISIIIFIIFQILSGKFSNTPPTISFTLTPAITPSITRTPGFSKTATITTITTTKIISTSTPTITQTPTQILLGVGYVNFALINAREKPNGKSVGTLTRLQIVTILDQTVTSGDRWYFCQWELDGTPQQGWILAEYIVLGWTPTPAFSP